MLGPTLYIITCTARNRMRRRLERLREPRYLIGALAGVTYLVFTLFIRQRAYRVRRRFEQSRSPASAAPAMFAALGPAIGGVLLACASLVSWLMPFQSGLLEFSQAETAFLFPSPLGRAQLVLYRLMRSQVAVLTGALIMALAYPTGSLTGRLRGLISVWLLLMTSHVFFTAVTLARRRLRQRDGSLAFAWPPLLLSAAAVLSVLSPLLAGAADRPLRTIPQVVDAVAAIASHGTAHLLTWPFVAVIRPLFADTLSDFLRALAGSVGMYVVTVAWLIWADHASPDAADLSAERQVTQPQQRARSYVARNVGWQLGPSGRQEAAFIWKGVLQTFRTVDRRVLARVLLIVAWMVGAAMFASRTRGLLLLLSAFSTWGAFFALFMAPQIIRTDLRQDLAHLELLKTWPIRGATIIRGEILWPASVVTVLAWLFGLLALLMSLPGTPRRDVGDLLAVGVAFLLGTPGVVLAEYVIHNAAALFFPGWVRLGTTRLRGVDAVGQRLILLVANWTGLLIALTPGIIVTAILFALLRHSIGLWALPLGAAMTTAMVVVEAVAATEALGPAYDALDLTSVERAD